MSSCLVPDVSGEDEEDTALLRELAKTAQNYIRSFSWRPPIKNMFLAFGVGGVVAVFLVEFPVKIHGTDGMLWVVVGDLPSAYLVVEPDDHPADALERYCELMEQWVVAVRTSGDLRKVFPVSAEPTAEHARMLSTRVEMIRTTIIPQIPLRGNHTR